MSNYDAETENGIGYIKALYSNSFKYQDTVDALDRLKPVREGILSGTGAVTQYTIGARSLSRQQLTATQVLEQWDSLINKKLRLEAGRKPRKAVGVVMRDW